MEVRAEPVRAQRFGAFELDLRAVRLHKNGRRIKLQDQPFQILVMLLERPGEIVSRDELQKKLWPAESFGDFDAGLNVAIKKLRDALGDSAERAQYIETIPRRGYRFVCPVETPAPPVESETPRRRLAWLVAGSAVLLIIVAALLTNVAGLRDRLFGPPTSPIDSVAVLPFKNLTGDTEQEYLADALTDDLTTELAQISRLAVPSVTSAMSYKSERKPLQEIARGLHVRAIVEGSIQRLGGSRIVINVQLIDASNDRHLFAKTYATEPAMLQPALREVAGDLVREMKVQLNPEEHARLENTWTANPQAYEALLRGRYHWRRGTEPDRAMARDLYKKAIELDPGYAAPYAYLALLYSHGGAYLAGSVSEGRAQIKQLADKALALDPASAEAHTALASYELADSNWQGAEREFQTAIRLNGNFTTARTWHAQFLGSLRRFDEAIAESQRVLYLDPASPDTLTHAAYPFFQAGRVDEAIALWQEVVKLDPSYWGGHNFLARGYCKKGMYAQGIAELNQAIALRGKPTQMDSGVLAYCYARSGQRTRALEITRAMEADPKMGAYGLVFAYVGLGEHDKAFAWLERDFQLRGRTVNLLSAEPLYEPLLSDPRYADLMKRVGFPPDAVQSAIASVRPPAKKTGTH